VGVDFVLESANAGGDLLDLRAWGLSRGKLVSHTRWTIDCASEREAMRSLFQPPSLLLGAPGAAV
jgi:hypothetical protein